MTAAVLCPTNWRDAALHGCVLAQDGRQSWKSTERKLKKAARCTAPGLEEAMQRADLMGTSWREQDAPKLCPRE